MKDTSIVKYGLYTRPESIFYPEGMESFADLGVAEGFMVDLSLDSWIIAIIGHKGAGKGVLATFLALKSAWRWNIPILSDYEMQVRIKTRNGTYRLLKSQSLDLQKILSFDRSLEGALLVISEAPTLINRMGSSSWRNRLMNLFFESVRHNHQSIIWCAQGFEYVERELRNATDLQLNVRDAYRLYPHSGVARGGVQLISMMDLSGQLTGRPYHEHPKTYTMRLNGQPLHGTFDSWVKPDILESLARVEVKLGKIIIGGEPDNGKTVLMQCVSAMMVAQQETGGIIESKELWAMVKPTPSEKNYLSKRMADYGVKGGRLKGSDKRAYDVSGVNLEDFMQG